MIRRGFASDNNAGVHSEVFEWMSRVNSGHVTGYGNDIYTEEAREAFRKQLGEQCEVFFVFTGTAANVLGISAITKSWNSVITPFTAHIEQDECGAPEKFFDWFRPVATGYYQPKDKTMDENRKRALTAAPGRCRH